MKKSIVLLLVPAFVWLGVTGLAEAASKNLLWGHNPSFEIALRNWTIEMSPDDKVKSVYGAAPECGRRSFRATNSQSVISLTSEPITLKPNTYYRISLQYKITSPDHMNEPAYIWYVDNTEANLTYTKGKWKRYTDDFYSFDATEPWRLRIDLVANGRGRVQMDCVALKEL